MSKRMTGRKRPQVALKGAHQHHKQSILTVHREVARRELREARIYDPETGRRRPSTLPKEV